MTPGKMISGDEYDAFTKRGRASRAFKAGQRAKIKRKFRKRQRKDARAQISEIAEESHVSVCESGAACAFAS